MERDIGTIDGNSAGELHQKFHDVFQGIADAERCKALTVRPFTPMYVATKNEWRKLDRDGRERSERGYDVEFYPNLACLEDDEVSARDSSGLTDTGCKKRRRSADNEQTTSSLPGPRRSRPYLERKAKS